MEGANHLFELGLRTRHKKISETWRKDLTDLRHAQDEALAEQRHQARRLLDSDIPRLKAHIKQQFARRLIGMYPLVPARFWKEASIDEFIALWPSFIEEQLSHDIDMDIDPPADGPNAFI